MKRKKLIMNNRWLRFDRMLTGGLWKQFTWITAVLVCAWGLSFMLLTLSGTAWSEYCLSHGVKPWLMPLYLLIDANAWNNLYYSDNADTVVHGWMLVVCCVTYLLGLLIFNGIIISVLSNYIAQRKESYTNGLARYSASGHYVIMGYDDMVPSIIADIFRNNPKAQVLILSAVNSAQIRERVRKSIKREHFDNIIVNYGHRIARDYYPDIHLEKAKEIFVVGKRTLPNHDAVNVECVENIFDYLAVHGNSNMPQRITCVFEDYDTYSAFKVADIFEKARELGVDFLPYNYYTGWAKQIFVSGHYYSTHNDQKHAYPSVWRGGIGYNDKHCVHLVFIGLSAFAETLALEAAHILHFPNGTTYSLDNEERQSIKTKITFIDKDICSEMRMFRTRNRHFFEIQSCEYYDFTDTPATRQKIQPSFFEGQDSDFLDIDFEFVNGDVYSDEVQNLLRIWAEDDNQYLSVFLMQDNQRDNFCVGMNMPDVVYDKSIPIFIRQENTDTFVTQLREAHTVINSHENEDNERLRFYIHSSDGKINKTMRTQRYANIYPFGMNDTAFYRNDMGVYQARLLNYLYSTMDNNTFTDMHVLSAIPIEQLKRDAMIYWRKLPIALKWSNLYAAEMIACKLTSMEVMKNEVNPLTKEQQQVCIAEVEHNRWNLEKLLMGYRKPKTEEDKYSISSLDEEGKEGRKKLYSNKKYHFVHSDIRPFAQLDNISSLDVEFNRYMPWVMQTALKFAENSHNFD